MPYELKTGRELSLLGVGAASLGAAYALGHSVEPLSSTKLLVLDRFSVNRFDRPATYRYSPTADQISDVTLAGTIGLVGVLTAGARPMRQDWKTVGLMYVETMLLTNGIKQSVKNLTLRIRPFVYNPNAPLADKVDVEARESFFSGHAANAFASAIFTSEVFRHYYPNSRLKPVIWIGSLGLATATSVLRYEAGKHYPSDLLVGAAFGSLVGWGIPKLHEVKNRRKPGNRLDVQPWSSGSATGIYVQIVMFSR